MNAHGKQGYTLVEMMVATIISAMVLIITLSGFLYAARLAKAGGTQVYYTAQSRLAAQKIVRYIEDGKAVGLASNGLFIVTLDLKSAKIYYQDTDGHSETVKDNYLMYDPDVTVSGNEKIICPFVTPIPGISMFGLIPSSPSSASVAFHLGDSPSEKNVSYDEMGDGFQGIQVRVSGTPRNLQRWYD